MKVTIKDCYVLSEDFQNQFIGKDVLPEPSFEKLKLSKRTAHQIRYEDVYILEPHKFYYVTFNETMVNEHYSIYVYKAFIKNGLMVRLESTENRLYIYNASQNIVYLQQGTKIGEVNYYG